MWAGLLNLLFPPRCAGCGERGESFCSRCRDGLHWILPPICARCGRPYLSFSALHLDGDEAGFPELAPPSCWCPVCKRNPPEFAVARSVAAYEGSLREAICALKFRGQKAVAAPLARLLIQFAPHEVLHDVEAVVPVPLHKDRLAQRGFNQAELVARPLAEAIGVPCLADALQRVRQEAPQAGLGAVDRWHNVEEAFVPGDGVRGPVLLVDDVFSTGATAGAAAGALLKAGAQRVAVLTVARTVLRGAPRPAVLLSHT